MKKIKIIFFLIVAIVSIMACSKDDDSNCNEIVCGGTSGTGTFTIFRGTLVPDTCGEIEITVNEATFLYYQAKWQANPEGYTCWEGLK
jgi:type 1 fimbria pilin